MCAGYVESACRRSSEFQVSLAARLYPENTAWAKGKSPIVANSAVYMIFLCAMAHKRHWLKGRWTREIDRQTDYPQFETQQENLQSKTYGHNATSRPRDPRGTVWAIGHAVCNIMQYVWEVPAPIVSGLRAIGAGGIEASTYMSTYNSECDKHTVIRIQWQ